MNIYYNTDGFRCDSEGSNVLNDPDPVIDYGSQPVWQFAIIDGATKTAATLTDISTWRAAIDSDFLVSTTPMCRTLSSSITASGNVVTVPWNARTSSFLTKVDGKEYIEAYAELWGYDSDAKPVFYLRIRIRARSVLDPDGGEAPAVETGYITEAEALAYIKKKNVYQFSADGSTNWHDTYTSTDLYYRERKDIPDSEWGAALPVGKSGVIIDNVNHTFTTTEGQAAAVTFTKTALGIASDSEPQVSLWSVSDEVKTQINTASYTVSWSADSLTVTYYTVWPAGSWIIKMS